MPISRRPASTGMRTRSNTSGSRRWYRPCRGCFTPVRATRGCRRVRMRRLRSQQEALAMIAELNLSWGLDGWIILAGALSAVASSLLGCFLVLRRMSMLGDAISHAVLPGLAAAFLISESRSSVTMFLGAVLVGILTAMLTEWIRGYGHVDEGASMGVVFTTLFALGLVLIVQAADHVDLDASCVLYGAIETIPLDTWRLFGWEIPRVVVILTAVTILNLLFVVGFYKELTLASFDPALATAAGVSAKGMHYLLMT